MRVKPEPIGSKIRLVKQVFCHGLGGAECDAPGGSTRDLQRILRIRDLSSRKSSFVFPVEMVTGLQWKFHSDFGTILDRDSSFFSDYFRGSDASAETDCPKTRLSLAPGAKDHQPTEVAAATHESDHRHFYNNTRDRLTLPPNRLTRMKR